ncbi:MAG: hypothetical protein ABI771_04960 [Betaproteobacteria bacterium]
MSGSAAAGTWLLEHPVRGPEKAARVFEQLTIGGMIHRFHAHYFARELRVVLLEKFYEFVLCFRRTDNQHFMRNREGFRDARIEVNVFWRFAAASRAFAVMNLARFAVRFNMDAIAFIPGKALQVCLAMVDPDYDMIVQHWQFSSRASLFPRALTDMCVQTPAGQRWGYHGIVRRYRLTRVDQDQAWGWLPRQASSDLARR